MSDTTAQLRAAGVSLWLDDLSRELLAGGTLSELIRDHDVVGVTSNPTIFASALAEGDRYDGQLHDLARDGVSVEAAVAAVTTHDVRDAADLLRPVWEATHGRDGLVSLEVDPGLADDTPGTLAAAQRLWATVDRPNLMIKIPATPQGLPAVAQALAAGISVNVTLIFALDRYREVIEAFLVGLEGARAAGRDLSTLSSVASFFVSRVDTEVDRRLDALGTPAAQALRGKAALANARLAYQIFEQSREGSRWAVLAAAGARPQRPLWASTGVKDPAYPDTLYVSGLVAPDTVNTVPLGTLRAFIDHGEIRGATVRDGYLQSARVLTDLAEVGVDLTEVTSTLEEEGVRKFRRSWAELTSAVADQLHLASSTRIAEEAQQ